MNKKCPFRKKEGGEEVECGSDCALFMPGLNKCALVSLTMNLGKLSR